MLKFEKLPKKILIIKPSALGDIVHSLPILNCLYKCFPGVKIHWVVAKGLHTFLEGHPLIEKLWIFNKDQWKKASSFPNTAKEVIAFNSGLKKEKFDVSIDLSGLLRSGLITWASRAKYKLGFLESDEGSPFFYSHKIEGDMTIHAIERYLKIPAFMGCDTSEVEYPLAPYDPNPQVCNELPENYIVMAPSAGKEANRWPAERFGKLAAKLPYPSAIISSPADAWQVDEVVAHASGNAINLAGKTNLKELIPVIGKAQFFISNDTGPMHIAAALNVPVFAIFGPANPNRTGPYGDIHTIIKEPMDCAPCYRWKPCDHWKCMELLTVDKVYGIINEKMEGVLS